MAGRLDKKSKTSGSDGARAEVEAAAAAAAAEARKRQAERGLLARLRARGGANTRLLWKGSTYFTAAVIFLAYPFVFRLDEWIDVELSPILPAMAVLVIVWIVLPLLVCEFLHRRWRRLDEAAQNAKSNRWLIGTRRTFGGAAVAWTLWVAFWI